MHTTCIYLYIFVNACRTTQKFRDVDTGLHCTHTKQMLRQNQFIFKTSLISEPTIITGARTIERNNPQIHYTLPGTDYVQ